MHHIDYVSLNLINSVVIWEPQFCLFSVLHRVSLTVVKSSYSFTELINFLVRPYHYRLSTSSSKPEPATFVRSRAIWSQSHNNSLAPLIYSLAHVASGSKPSHGNTNSNQSRI